jgi:cytochrome c553
VNIRSPREVFATAKPYAESKPAVRANSRHAQPVTGKDCMSCHAAGGTAPQFAYGGTIKQGEDWDWKWNWPEQRDGASPATEVRVIGADGLVFQTVTDEDGNFWFKTRSPLQQPAFTGIRKGAFQRSLVSNGPACGSCHENGQQDARKEQPGPIWTWDGEDPGGDAWGDKWGDDWGGGGWGGGW